ncbi:hypothetical protein TKK_0008416 [Trichogramma kaykai]
MENRKNSVSIKEEPFDDWSGVGDNPDDQVDSCTAENFEYQLTINKPSANDMNESMPLEEGREEIILVDFDSKNVKTEVDFSSTSICKMENQSGQPIVKLENEARIHNDVLYIDFECRDVKPESGYAM